MFSVFSSLLFLSFPSFRSSLFLSLSTFFLFRSCMLFPLPFFYLIIYQVLPLFLLAVLHTLSVFISSLSLIFSFLLYFHLCFFLLTLQETFSPSFVAKFLFHGNMDNMACPPIPKPPLPPPTPLWSQLHTRLLAHTHTFTSVPLTGRQTSDLRGYNSVS